MQKAADSTSQPHESREASRGSDTLAHFASTISNSEFFQAAHQNVSDTLNMVKTVFGDMQLTGHDTSNPGQISDTTSGGGCYGIPAASEEVKSQSDKLKSLDKDPNAGLIDKGYGVGSVAVPPRPADDQLKKPTGGLNQPSVPSPERETRPKTDREASDAGNPAFGRGSQTTNPTSHESVPEDAREDAAEGSSDDPLADGVLDFNEAIDLFAEADQADMERQEQVDKLLDRIPEGPVRDLMREASSQLLDSAQLDTEKIQSMLKDAKEKLGESEFYKQMEDVMKNFSPEFREQFGIGLSLNRTQNDKGEQQDALLISKKTYNGHDNRQTTILAVTESGAPRITQLKTTIRGEIVVTLNDDPAKLFNKFGNAALDYYGENH